MGTEAERQDTRKTMAYDLIQILEARPEKESYTTEEMKKSSQQSYSTLSPQSYSNDQPGKISPWVQ